MKSSYLLIVFITVLLPPSNTEFVSLGMQRYNLSDSEFSFSFSQDGFSTVNTSGINVYVLAAPRDRLLGMPDVNSVLVRAYQRPGFVIPWHVHPRGCESYATISGTIQITLILELVTAMKPRKIVSKLPSAHAASVPQGMPHSVKCISDDPCEYHTFFNTADPGFVPISYQETE